MNAALRTTLEKIKAREVERAEVRGEGDSAHVSIPGDPVFASAAAEELRRSLAAIVGQDNATIIVATASKNQVFARFGLHDQELGFVADPNDEGKWLLDQTFTHQDTDGAQSRSGLAGHISSDRFAERYKDVWDKVVKGESSHFSDAAAPAK